MSLEGRSPNQAASFSGPFSKIWRGDIRSSNPRVQALIDAGPKRGAVALVVLGMALGMLTAYMVIPTEFTGASPRHMSQQAVQQWARMVAVGHSQNIHYDDSNALLVLQQIPNPQAVIGQLANSASVPAAERAALQALSEIPGFSDISGPLAPQDPGLAISALQVILALAVVALGLPVLTIIGRTALTRAEGDAAAPTTERDADDAGQAFVAYREQAGSPPLMDDETARRGPAPAQNGQAVLHALSSYVKGSNYDDSFAIELGGEGGNQFLGECGISGATSVGGELQSVEFWGFDMASQETLTKVFAAPAALADPNLHAAVADRIKDPATDIVAAEPGARLLLDSHAIQIQAEIASVVCNYGGGTPNSGIESLQIELLAWRKQNQGAALPAADYPAPASSPFNEYADLELTPPAQSNAPAPPPPAGGLGAPAKAKAGPAAKRPEDEEEDPFGGTGNFMPYT